MRATTGETVSGGATVVTPGRTIVLLDLYLLLAARIAFDFDVLIAPPVLIVLIADHWVPLGLITAAICGIEFAVYRTFTAVSVLVFALIFAAFPFCVRLAALVR